MTPRQFYYSLPRERLEEVALDAGTSFGNFKQIAIANGSCSPDLAARLAAASQGRMTEMEILYPSRFDQSA